ISNLPSCCRTAPVKAPFSWPNRLLSTSSDGTAARLTGMNGPSAFGDSSCSRRAIISLPVPLSPCTSTVVSSRATLRTRSMTWRMTALVPVGDLRRQRLDLAAEILLLAGVAHQRAQRVVLEVLGDEVVGALLDRLYRDRKSTRLNSSHPVISYAVLF